MSLGRRSLGDPGRARPFPGGRPGGHRPGVPVRPPCVPHGRKVLRHLVQRLPRPHHRRGLDGGLQDLPPAGERGRHDIILRPVQHLPGLVDIQQGAAHAVDEAVAGVDDPVVDHHGPTIGVGWTEDFKTFRQLENAFLPYNRNGVLFPRKINGMYMMLSRPSDTGHRLSQRNTPAKPSPKGTTALLNTLLDRLMANSGGPASRGVRTFSWKGRVSKENFDAGPCFAYVLGLAGSDLVGDGAVALVKDEAHGGGAAGALVLDQDLVHVGVDIAGVLGGHVDGLALGVGGQGPVGVDLVDALLGDLLAVTFLLEGKGIKRKL